MGRIRYPYYSYYLNEFTEQYHLLQHLGKLEGGAYGVKLIGSFGSVKEVKEFCKRNKITLTFVTDRFAAWTQDEIEVLMEHYNTAPISWIEERLPSRDRSQIYYKASKLGLKRRDDLLIR